MAAALDHTHRRRAAGALLALLAMALPASAEQTHGLRAEIASEYLWPIDEGRQIDTVSVHALVGDGILGASWISWRAGLTVTYAWGHIVQLDDQLREVRSDNAAAGLGPVGLLRLQTPELARLSVGAEASGGVLLYTSGFPAGGDIYNFMGRAGLLLEGRVADAIWLGGGYHVMHVSNGQGLGPHNPSYEAQGVALWLSWAFDRI